MTKLRNITYPMLVHIHELRVSSVYRLGDGRVFRKISRNRHQRVVHSFGQDNVWVSQGTPPEEFDIIEDAFLLQEPETVNSITNRNAVIIIIALLLLVFVLIILEIKLL